MVRVLSSTTDLTWNTSHTDYEHNFPGFRMFLSFVAQEDSEVSAL
jgi:hypothetical protein